MVGNCPTQWLSKLQTKIAVSTMEAEHIALITAMYDLIPLQTLMDKVEELLRTKSLPSCTNSEILEDNNGALILATSPWDDTSVQAHCHKAPFPQRLCSTITRNDPFGESQL